MQSKEFEDMRDKLKKCKTASVLKLFKFSNNNSSNNTGKGQNEEGESEKVPERRLEPAANETIVDGKTSRLFRP